MALLQHRRFSRLPSAVAVALVALATHLCVTTHVAAENTYPIILVHGFTGWARSEFNGYKYWGGHYGDWQEKLKAQGHDVRTAVVGPFSSNWDRACELYAYIKGGTVHYGANHAKTHKHNVTGRTFPGIFPQWGEVVDGQVQKIHLIGHSQGGQTSRMLAQLLAHGTRGAPIQEDPASHPLFAGGHDGWIHSITTLSTPHLGTTLGDMFDNVRDFVSGLMGVVSGTLSLVHPDAASSPAFYDAKLDQFGLGPRRASESLASYTQRIASSAVFESNNHDTFLHSTSTYGARKENAWVVTLPNIYYYSFSFESTNLARNVLLRKVALPQPAMAPLLWPFSLLLGSRYAVDTLGYPESWLTNDGAVNTESMRSPGGAATVVEFTSESVPGRWHHVARIQNCDHLGSIGSNAKQKNMFSVYAAHAALLKTLPVQPATAGANKRALRGRDTSVAAAHTAPAAVIERLQLAIAQANDIEAAS